MRVCVCVKDTMHKKVHQKCFAGQLLHAIVEPPDLSKHRQEKNLPPVPQQQEKFDQSQKMSQRLRWQVVT